MRDNNNSNNSNTSTNNSVNDSTKSPTSPLLSPKVNKMDSFSARDEEVSRQYLMKKRSPTKVYDEKETSGVNTSINYKGEQFSKNDRSNRF